MTSGETSGDMVNRIRAIEDRLAIEDLVVRYCVAIDDGRTIHIPEAHTVSFTDADHATGLVLSHAELDIQHQTVHTFIRYYDDYERGEDGAWRFANRTLKFAYAVPVEQMNESLTGVD